MLPADVPPKPTNSTLSISAAFRAPASAAPSTPPPSKIAYAFMPPDALRLETARSRCPKLFPPSIPLGREDVLPVATRQVDAAAHGGEWTPPCAVVSLDQVTIPGREIDVLRAGPAVRRLPEADAAKEVPEEVVQPHRVGQPRLPRDVPYRLEDRRA